MLKVVDLFTGAGGLSCGFADRARFETLFANDIMEDAIETYRMNHPGVPAFADDIAAIDRRSMEEELGRSCAADIVIGGPPCQAYSTVGRRLLDDPRASLFQEYFRILREFEPRVFLYENVTGLLSMDGGNLVKEIIALFSSLGYELCYEVMNAADYGAPQFRRRVILVGTLLGVPFEFPDPTVGTHLTLGEALGDLPLVPSEPSTYACDPRNAFQEAMRDGAPDTIADHVAPRHNARLRAIMEALPDGGTLADLPEDFPEEYRPTSGFANSYARLWWNRPSVTLTRNFGTPSSSRCIHPKAPRALTTREGARIQTFPDSYRFHGSRSSKNLQIGNAVPPVLARVLAGAIQAHFEADRNRRKDA